MLLVFTTCRMHNRKLCYQSYIVEIHESGKRFQLSIRQEAMQRVQFLPYTKPNSMYPPSTLSIEKNIKQLTFKTRAHNTPFSPSLCLSRYAASTLSGSVSLSELGVCVCVCVLLLILTHLSCRFMLFYHDKEFIHLYQILVRARKPCGVNIIEQPSLLSVVVKRYLWAHWMDCRRLLYVVQPLRGSASMQSVKDREVLCS